MPEVTDFVPELVCLGIDVAICGVISQSWIFVHITLYTARLCTRLWEAPVLYWDNSLPPQSYHWMSTLWPGFISALPPNKVFLGTRDLFGTFFVWLLFPLSSIVFSLENHPAAVRSSDLTSVRLPYAAVRGEVDSLGAELLGLYLTNYSSTGKTVVTAYAPGELKGVIQKVWSRYSLYPQSIATQLEGGVHRAQAKHEQNWVLGGFPTSDALLH